jgi:hypothetical protein
MPYEKASGGTTTTPDDAGSAVRVPVVQNVKGSSAGVGSGYFHTYRLQRRREMQRLKDMDTQHEVLTADQEHMAQLELNKLEDEERTLKRAGKRQKRKEKDRAKRQRKEGHLDVAAAAMAELEDEEDDDEAEEDLKASAAQLAAAAVAEADAEEEELLTNDGKFLERFLKQHESEATAPAAATQAVAADADAPVKEALVPEVNPVGVQ